MYLIRSLRFNLTNLVLVIEYDVLPLVDGDVQVGESPDGGADQVQVSAPLVLGSPREERAVDVTCRTQESSGGR